ncbi:RNA polymerase sigma-70 factor (ECF subfamily) [Neolewinella xylanilytica]|uniref:RNA polymerase sigma-70 factor (ECF subfamily) n=1 Tax=Neolewinella xylanilytica TaxID=1514080 RepID=A0A2S6I7B8_9BACT|nr:RNA polymerase sigma-70 factor [Neolewinella xylanilytica]PPK87394.1 RNA polymerase sigma-70 factor (ECF subfamily) [Neolewinella xylanilytica]
MEPAKIDDIKAGNVAAFRALFDAEYDRLANFALRYVGETAVAEDIVQDVFVALWSKRAELSIQVSLKAYLYQSVRNGCLNHLKSRKVRTTYAASVDARHWEHPTLEEQIDAESLGRMVQRCVTEMPKERQRIFRLSREEGLKYREIAVELGLSVKTVEAQMGKALQFLRGRLSDFLPLLLLNWMYTFFHVP